jgi:acyl-CoA synthetase (AMP-forming)/AMP-acid ligase II
VSFAPSSHLAALPYSSGTTGIPKGVMLTHRNLVANVAQIRPLHGMVADDVVLAVLPFFHIYGMTVLLNAALQVRARLVVMPSFDLAEFLGNIDNHKCTIAFIAPPLAVALAKHPMIDDYDLSSLNDIMSGATPLVSARPANCGSRDPTCSPGNEQATREIIDDEGWLHTGDLAQIDARGCVYIVDRLKELIKYKGYQVPPAELEAVLLTHPSIADAAVIGVKDDRGEELPKAFVVRQSGAELTADEVIDFVAGQVAPYKKVRQVEFIDAIPKSMSGKILRKDLRPA